MSFKKSHNLLSVKINCDKKEEFKQWCQKNDITMTQLINQFIDSCLSEEELKISELLSHKDLNIDSKTDLILQEAKKEWQNAIASLEKRIEKLENQLKSTSINGFKGKETTQNLENINLEEETTIDEFNQIPKENRLYLTRSQIWQKLKQTKYVETNGYDSLLRATAEEFISYGIYFDKEKKCYYIEINN